MPDLHPTHIPTPETPPFEIEAGCHVGCGGRVVYAGDSTHAKCTKCGLRSHPGQDRGQSAATPVVPFEIEDGLHVGCGGQVVIGLDGIRVTCIMCQVIETWKQAAVRLHDSLDVAYDHILTEVEAAVQHTFEKETL